MSSTTFSLSHFTCCWTSKECALASELVENPRHLQLVSLPFVSRPYLDSMVAGIREDTLAGIREDTPWVIQEGRT